MYEDNGNPRVWSKFGKGGVRDVLKDGVNVVRGMLPKCGSMMVLT